MMQIMTSGAKPRSEIHRKIKCAFLSILNILLTSGGFSGLESPLMYF